MRQALDLVPTVLEMRNGPIVQVELHCHEYRCDSSTNAFIRQFAEDWDAEAVRPESPMPDCRWERSDRKPQGVRVSVDLPALRAGAELTISIHCNARHGFSEWATFQLQHVDGRWMIGQQLLHAIT